MRLARLDFEVGQLLDSVVVFFADGWLKVIKVAQVYGLSGLDNRTKVKAVAEYLTQTLGGYVDFLARAFELAVVTLLIEPVANAGNRLPLLAALPCFFDEREVLAVWPVHTSFVDVPMLLLPYLALGKAAVHATLHLLTQIIAVLLTQYKRHAKQHFAVGIIGEVVRYKLQIFKNAFVNEVDDVATL